MAISQALLASFCTFKGTIIERNVLLITLSYSLSADLPADTRSYGQPLLCCMALPGPDTSTVPGCISSQPHTWKLPASHLAIQSSILLSFKQFRESLFAELMQITEGNELSSLLLHLSVVPTPDNLGESRCWCWGALSRTMMEPLTGRGVSVCWGLSKVATVTYLLQLSKTGSFIAIRIVERENGCKDEVHYDYISFWDEAVTQCVHSKGQLLLSFSYYPHLTRTCGHYLWRCKLHDAQEFIQAVWFEGIVNDFQRTARSDEQRGESLEGYSALGGFGFKYTHMYILL